MPPFDWNIFLLGCVGGLLPDLLRFIKNRYEKAAPFYYYGSFWLGLALLVGLGGFSAWIAGASEVKDALAFGFAAPEVFSKLVSERGPGAAGAVDRGGAGFSLRRWWKG